MARLIAVSSLVCLEMDYFWGSAKSYLQQVRFWLFIIFQQNPTSKGPSCPFNPASWGLAVPAVAVTGARQQRPRRSSPLGSSHTCTPPPPSLASPGPGLRTAGAQGQSGLWRGHSGSRGPGVGRPPSRWTPPRTGQRGSCTGRSTACCAVLLFGIRPPSHAGRTTGRVEFWGKQGGSFMNKQSYCHSFQRLYPWKRRV